jgi:hypothetical protein
MASRADHKEAIQQALCPYERCRDLTKDRHLIVAMHTVLDYRNIGW